jgi:hypothetical protein
VRYLSYGKATRRIYKAISHGSIVCSQYMQGWQTQFGARISSASTSQFLFDSTVNDENATGGK